MWRSTIRSSVDLLRTALARHRGVDVPLVVLVRDRCIVTHARANGLGATDILPIDTPPRADRRTACAAEAAATPAS